MWTLSGSSKEHMLGVHPDLIEITELALLISTIDFGIPSTGGLRTAECQNDLYRDNKSNCDGIVQLSKHQTGQALDFYAYVDGKASWDKHHLAMVAAALLQAAARLRVPLKWGGNWKNFKDYPHVELG